MIYFRPVLYLFFNIIIQFVNIVQFLANRFSSLLAPGEEKVIA